MSRSDEILNRLVSLTRRDFVAAWERVGTDAFRLRASGEIFTRAWVNAVLQEVHTGADLDAMLPAPPPPPPAPVRAGEPSTAAQWRSIREADEADTRRTRRRR
ncbi:hypothetical protein SAMN04488103_102434 [Gemmobacter aquatilis]|uniref:Uncharacterized protein n=1 Tax=Gemmobacter aquatilis TaxID=933059 RepID=A0A1H8CBG2_9RHOB|nr:hypothetical protein [Gemmobacter aquatilis]SEM91598.1 hypothetical protein SAMN04488103_102434 [Gemmobacter aquatilis]